MECMHTMKNPTAAISQQFGSYTMIKAQDSVLLKIHTTL